MRRSPAPFAEIIKFPGSDRGRISRKDGAGEIGDGTTTAPDMIEAAASRGTFVSLKCSRTEVHDDAGAIRRGRL